MITLLGLAYPLCATAADRVEAKTAAPAEENVTEGDDILTMAAYNAKADRIEDFGLRVGPSFLSEMPKTTLGFFVSRFVPIIYAVVPNTAADKAGLKPGERILKSDGQSLVTGLLSSVQLKKWRLTEKRKWEEVAAGKKDVTWTLEVQAQGTKVIRTVKLVVPSPPPHWGASIWQAPQGRTPATVAENGPLTERSRTILDHGVASLLRERYTQLLGLDFKNGLRGDALSGREPTGYEWHLGDGRREGMHEIVVTQFRGRTDVFFHTRSPATGLRFYLTSPSGALEKAWLVPPQGKQYEMPLAEARVGFEHELDFWTTKVVRGIGHWPFEVKSGYDANAIFAVLAPKNAAPTAETARPLPAEFLKLRSATEAEKALFTTAYGKLGADPDRWAYTETSRGLEDKRLFVTRVDPSKPAGERSVLLSVDGKAPTPADVQGWRDDGGDTPKALGELPPIADIVDLKELRIFQDDAAAVVFELPMRGGNADFPTEKFQAHFRVNKTHRAFEQITVKQRDSFRVAGVVKVVDAGLEMRFQTIDAALAPQPVLLKAGGGVRVLLVKLSRSFEATRADFKRVVPFDETAAPAK